MESISCPGCDRPIRVPVEVLGQRAQCPFCKCHFRAPGRQDDGTLAVPTLIRRNPFGRSRTYAPGMLLVFVGLLGVVTNAVDILRTQADPEAFARKTREDFEIMAERQNSPGLRDWGEFTVKWLPRARFGFLGLSLLTVGGGVAMIRQRGHSLAMLGSVAALFNVVNCCCVMGFPAGAWSLYVLMNPEIRAQFQPPGSAAAGNGG